MSAAPPGQLLGALLGLLAAAAGLMLGYVAWVVLWSLPWFKYPWVIENGQIMINEPFDAIGKLITFLTFPAAAAFYGATYAYGFAAWTPSKVLEKPEVNM